MEQLPKIVQQRLSAADKAGVHPDPDLLTAFAERSLNERERVQVLQHLGGCADCRNIVSLAMPEDVAPSSAGVAGAASSARSRWLSWPVLRWGALGACVIVVGAAVTLHYDWQSEPQLGRQSEHQSERQATGAESPKIAAAPESRSNSVVQSPAPIQPSQKLAEKNPTSLFKSDRGLDSASKLDNRSLDEQSFDKRRDDASAESRFAAAPAAIGGVDARRKEGQPLESGAQPTGHAGNAQLADADRANPGTKNNDALKALDKPSAQSAGNLIAAAPAPPPAPLATESKAASAEGQAREQAGRAGAEKDEKQKSEKTGNDKEESEGPIGVVNETVTVMADAPVIQTATAEVASAKGKSGKKKNKAQTLSALDTTVRWTLSSDGAVQRSLDSGKSWQTIPVASSVVFRALAATASDIWVGGLEGALYHSSDGGEHWVQVSPAAGGESLTGDVVGIEFADSRNGKVITSTRVSWSTSDGGATWHRN
jgi:hypothetical protein